jgi:hypothetical protein
MLDLVPLACTGRQVTHGDGNGEFIGQPLQLVLPQSDARAGQPEEVRVHDYAHSNALS